MRRFASPSLLDSEVYRFPATNPATGRHLCSVWRWENERTVRVRMKDIKKGDVFLVRSPVPNRDVWLIAEDDAAFHQWAQDWGVDAHPYNLYDG